MALHLHSLTFAAAYPQALAGFWAGVTGYQPQTVNEFVAILSGDGSVGPSLMFIKVPEDKTAGNEFCIGRHGRRSTDAHPVRAEGLEPPSPEGHRLLRPARLPVPPRSLVPSLSLRQLR
jgi:hypothetical protein